MRIIYITDFDMRGSGYFNIAANLAEGLQQSGHEVMVLGLSYKDEEHFYSFSVLPANDMGQVAAMYHNLVALWKPQITICAMDIPLNSFLMSQLGNLGVPWIAITALESGPLCQSWAIGLMPAKKIFFISEYAAQEANKVGVPAEHIQIGIDTQLWKRRTDEDYRKAREYLLGITDPETFIVFQVADNQERKNLSGAMEIMQMFGEKHPNFRYVLLTRPDNTVGWKLRDLAQTLGISKKYIEFDRKQEIDQDKLWKLYSAADVYLSTSKGEGLGLPVMEAMAVGVPVIGSSVGATTELLLDGRGWLIGHEYEMTDPYGNAKRYYIDRHKVVDTMSFLYEHPEVTKEKVQFSWDYIDTRTWDIPVEQINKAIREMYSEQAEA